AQETIDSLEMVRQLFENGVLQSGFWHRFAMTSHSPVGLAPDAFDVQRIGPSFGGFADNDLYHDDPKGANHDLYSEGLRKSLFNYMHGVGFDIPLSKWFDSKVPTTTIPPNYIQRQMAQNEDSVRKNAFVVWLGKLPNVEYFEVKQGKKVIELAELHFYDKKHDWSIQLPAQQAHFWEGLFPKIAIHLFEQPLAFQQLQTEFEAAHLGSFSTFSKTPTWKKLRENGLLIL
ncbi:MAG TPA: radical SAM protein, partial [Runella sp.]|nr:radical SAM protein [Runella sp.]